MVSSEIQQKKPNEGKCKDFGHNDTTLGKTLRGIPVLEEVRWFKENDRKFWGEATGASREKGDFFID